MRYIVEDRQPDVMMFDSKDDLIDYVEWYDVEDGEYRVWDGDGIRQELLPGQSLEHDVAMESTGIDESREAAQAISRYLQGVRPGLIDPSQALSLPELLELYRQAFSRKKSIFRRNRGN